MLLVPLPRRPDWRHPPLVTLAIMVLCTLIYFFWQIPGDKVQEQALDYYGKSVLREAELPAYLNYLSEQGGEKARRLRQAYAHDRWPLVLAAMENDGEFQLRLHRGQVITPHSPLYPQWQTARRHYEDLRNRAVTSRYAFTPTDPRPITWLSHMFLHGDESHLVGNMVILFITGYLVEEALGSRRYLLYYLLAGLGAAGLDLALHGQRSTGSIGASGAIAGVMAMFVVLFGARPIRFFYWIIFYFDFCVAPAILALPLWLANEAYQLWAHPESPINYVAHMGGFVAGALLAAWFRWRNPHQALPDPGATLTPAPGEAEPAASLARIQILIRELKVDEGVEALRRLSRRYPEDETVVNPYYQLAKLHPADDHYHRAAARVFALPAGDGAREARVREVLLEYMSLARPCVRFTPDGLATLARRLILAGYGEDGERLIRALQARNPDHAQIAPLLMVLARHHARQGNQEAFRRGLETLRQNFPDTEEARLATQLLR